MENELSYIELTHYTDPEVLSDIQEFHAKTLFTSLNEAQNRTYVSSIPLERQKRFENKEIKINQGFTTDYNMSLQTPIHHERFPSRINFRDNDIIHFSIMEKLLFNSFSPYNDETKRRPYASGGGQYPIEVFLCKLSDKIEGWPVIGNVLHYLPLSRGFEVCDSEDMHTINRALAGGDKKRLGSPHFAIVYFIFFEKALLKYRYRGYRMATMEAGSMYQMACFTADSIGLRNRVWAGFTDTFVCKSLGMDMRSTAPLSVQFFGL